jgi:hypothetical protein
MKKLVSNVLCMLVVGMFVWGLFSWCEVIKDNHLPREEDEVISEYNLFNLLINREEEYTKNGVVIDEYTVKDSRGEEWTTAYPIGYSVGDEVVITFTNNKTRDMMYDDGIVRLDLKV